MVISECAVLAPARRDPFAYALSRSTTASAPTFGSKLANYSISSPSSDQTPLPRTGNASPITDGMEMSFDDISKERTSSNRLGSGAYWRCQVIVAAPAAPTEPVVAVKGGKVDKNKPKAEADHLIRANSLAGYVGCQRADDSTATTGRRRIGVPGSHLAVCADLPGQLAGRRHTSRR
jgi:hypothetical protein